MGFRSSLPRDLLLVLLMLGAAGLSGCGGEREEHPAASSARAPKSEQDAPPEPVPEIPDDAPLVVFLGDSLTAGLHLSASEAFPAVLQRRLAAAGLPFRLVNAGVSGDTTAAGLARVDWILKQAPEIVVVELGVNDGFRGLSLEVTESNLREILRRIRARRSTALLLGMKLPPNYGPQRARDFEALYARLAKEGGVAFVPFFMEGVAGVPGLNLSDGIHPTAEGHRRLALGLEKPLTRLLRR